MKEAFVVLVLNTRKRIIGHNLVALGSLDTCPVVPLSVFRPVIVAAGSSIILIHNHPSGDPQPSQADIKVTRDLARAGQLLKIEITDHIIIGQDKHTSLRSLGWAAWAYLQAARTGMTARELPEQETPEKAKERFASWHSDPSDDWLYFGTVHHHCSASAFQSSTDEQNEWNQDGLHITVGKMDGERHELHARFYLDGNAYEPDLSRFWAIDPELAEQVPTIMHHHLAVHQMGGQGNAGLRYASCTLPITPKAKCPFTPQRDGDDFVGRSESQF